jgi:hypothetical protein
MTTEIPRFHRVTVGANRLTARAYRALLRATAAGRHGLAAACVARRGIDPGTIAINLWHRRNPPWANPERQVRESICLSDAHTHGLEAFRICVITRS